MLPAVQVLLEVPPSHPEVKQELETPNSAAVERQPPAFSPPVPPCLSFRRANIIITRCVRHQTTTFALHFKKRKALFVSDPLMCSAAPGVENYSFYFANERTEVQRTSVVCAPGAPDSGLGRSLILDSSVGQASSSRVAPGGTLVHPWAVTRRDLEQTLVDKAKQASRFPFNPVPAACCLAHGVNHPAYSCPSLLPGCPTLQTEKHPCGEPASHICFPQPAGGTGPLITKG